VHIIAAKAVAFGEALREDFKEYQRQTLANAKILASELQEQGLRVVSGGTDNHLMLVDVWMDGKGITGKDAEKALEAAHITVNKNTIPFDQNKPFVASGLRIGTPAVTTRGMKESEMREIGRLIAAVVHEPQSEDVRQRVQRAVGELTAKFPLYPKRLKQYFGIWDSGDSRSADNDRIDADLAQEYANSHETAAMSPTGEGRPQSDAPTEIRSK
jgi:glycine hydroxymethyltransferase